MSGPFFFVNNVYIYILQWTPIITTTFQCSKVFFTITRYPTSYTSMQLLYYMNMNTLQISKIICQLRLYINFCWHMTVIEWSYLAASNLHEVFPGAAPVCLWYRHSGSPGICSWILSCRLPNMGFLTGIIWL